MRRVEDREPEVGDPEPERPATEPAALEVTLGPVRTVALNPATMAALQRSAGNAAAARAVQAPGDAFAAATSGPTSELPHRHRMETAFGRDFAGVTAHVGTASARYGLGALGASAAAFGDSVAFAESDPDPHVVAHELAHVVQQRGAGRAVAAKPTAVSRPDDRAERAADRAAGAVDRGAPVSALGRVDGGTLHRTTVKTNGGEFDDAPFYTAVSGTGVKWDVIGANIGLDFTPGDLVEAPVNGVALVQTVKAVTDRKPGDAKLHAARDHTDTAASTDKDESQLVAPNGAAVDVSIHRPGRKDANHNPIYGVGFGSAAPSTSLKDGIPSLGRSQRGAHVRDPITGAFLAPVKAQMADGPRRTLEVDGQTFEMSFEVAAVVTHGPMANTYLGSIEWGWTSDASGTVTLKPLVALASGAPTAAFMEAAGVWNKSTFHDKDKKKTEVQSVDLPITTLPSGVQAAVDMTTTDIVARLPVVRAELAAMKAGPSVDRTNKEFERLALETELAKRKIKIDLSCLSLSDTGGAAAPPEDEVWLALSGGGAPTLALTAQRKFRKGDAHSWQFPVKDFLPLSSAMKIEVNEHDRAGAGGRAHDDALIDFDWLPPFATTVRFDKGAHYAAVIGFDK